MRRAALLLAAFLAGCGQDRSPPPPPTQKPPPDASLIRGWSRALNAGDYPRAASYFARDAMVQQAQKFRLPSRLAAIVFNRGLPCRADITRIRDEGQTSLASFRLRRGPGGPCSGRARVRFRIERGKFTEWRQLPEPAPPPGDTA